MSTAVMVYNVCQVPDLSSALVVYSHLPSSTSTLAAVAGLQLMIGNKDDLSAFVPAQLFTMLGKLPNSPVCIYEKRQCTGQIIYLYMLSSLSALLVCSYIQPVFACIDCISPHLASAKEHLYNVTCLRR